MTQSETWKTSIDEYVAEVKQIQKDGSPEKLENLPPAPAHARDSQVEGRAKLMEVYSTCVDAARRKFESLQAGLEALKVGAQDEDVWKSHAAALAREARAELTSGLDGFVNCSKEVIGGLPETVRGPNADYLIYCANGYVLFNRKVIEAVDNSMGGVTRGEYVRGDWSSLETAKDTVRQAVVAAMRWLSGEGEFTSASVSLSVSL